MITTEANSPSMPSSQWARVLRAAPGMDLLEAMCEERRYGQSHDKRIRE
jgi:hypothetical protein